MKTKLYLILTLFLFFPLEGFSWGRHDLLTTYALKEVKWLDPFDAIPITSFQDFLSDTFSKDFTERDFLAQYQLNSSYKVKPPPSNIKTLSAKKILADFSDEPDWGMDQNLNISLDQPYMGGIKGPTSQAFRHLYWKAWSPTAPLRTFHFPPREMGQARERAQIFYNLAEKAFKAKHPYWAFRFLAWTLHYIQDLNQPFHSSQLLTPKFIAWEEIFNFKKLVHRTTQIISNYHFIYEDYVVYRIEEEMKDQIEKKFIPALVGEKQMYSSSAFLIAKHSADDSNYFSYEIGETCFHFFGKRFLDPKIDVPNSPKGTFPMKDFDQNTHFSKKEKDVFLQNTAKNLNKTAIYTRSLLELSKEEFLSNSKK